jgi:histidine triad (HIT) family protein
MPDCLFCSVVAGSLEVQTVLQTPAVVAFLDHRPVFKGHVIVVPREHIPTLADLAPQLVGAYFLDVRRVAIGVETGVGAAGTFVALNNKVSQSVPHLHTHVVPRTQGDGLRGFFWPRTKYAGPAEADDYAARIAACVPS